MCGIAGFLRRDGWGDRQLSPMLDSIDHRGPDDRGTYLDEIVALGSTLLAIVDIGYGHQPVIRPFGGETYVGVFNGEVYNYRALRHELEAAGFHFSTDCDTEVAVAAFAVWGDAAAQRLDGQFALVLWEARRGRLTLVRDPFGIKPLFCSTADGGLAFASEPKAILTLPGISRQPDVDAIREYFLHGFAFAAGYSLSHRSFFRGIRSLPPGHMMHWTRREGLTVTPYFRFPLHLGSPIDNRIDAVAEMEQAVAASAEASMMGDAPLGVALSGGLDSSIITSVAAAANARAGRPPLLASCIRYGAQAINEDAAHATLLAEWLGDRAPVRLVFSSLEPEHYLADVDALVTKFDEPHWEVKQLAMFNNYRALKAHGAKVVLTGEGADELFFGYYHRFPGFRNPVITSAARFRELWSARIPQVMSLLSDTGEADLRRLQDEAINLFYAPYCAAGERPDRAMQCWYLATFLHWLLIDNDRCSMAFSLEGRFPFLNRAVFELAFRIAPSLQVGAEFGQEKLILREAFRQRLPEAIWLRRKKAPLPSPLRLSFHRQIERALTAEIDNAHGDLWTVLSRSGVIGFLEAFRIGLAELERSGEEAAGGERLTRYLSLEEPWSVRTPQAFGLLTLFRWWAINFG